MLAPGLFGTLQALYLTMLIRWDRMHPPAALTNPDYTVGMINFRLSQFPQALRNAQEDYVQDKYKFSNDSALYPWTTGAWGNATGTGPVLDYEYHVNTDIALEMFQHLAFSGDERLFKEKHWPVVMGIAKSMTTLLQPDGGKWSLRNMTDPDEFAVCTLLQLLNLYKLICRLESRR